MKNRFSNKILHFVLSILFYGVVLNASAQNKSNSKRTPDPKTNVLISAKADRNRIFIGEQIKVSYVFEYSGDKKSVKWITVPDSLNHLEVVERSSADSLTQGNKYSITQSFVITGFDSGHWVVPSFPVTVDKRVYKTDSIAIDVMPVKLKGDAYNEIKEIIEVNKPEKSSKLWIGIVVTILVLAALAYYYFSKKKPPPPNPMGFDTRLTPFDQAVQELKKLKDEGLSEKGEMKNYYSRLYDIYRVYLQRQFSLPVLQSTTDEFLIIVKDKLGRDETGKLAEVLRIADAVKFAKYQSSAEEAKNGYAVIENGIRSLHQQKT